MAETQKGKHEAASDICAILSHCVRAGECRKGRQRAGCRGLVNRMVRRVRDSTRTRDRSAIISRSCVGATDCRGESRSLRNTSIPSLSGDDDWNPRYNIAPTQSVPVIRQNPKDSIREFSMMRWGLIPHCAKDPSIATNTINAKSETAATKPAFRDPLNSGGACSPQMGFMNGERREQQSSRTALK